jgi:preprotein translocase subunit YajC
MGCESYRILDPRSPLCYALRGWEACFAVTQILFGMAQAGAGSGGAGGQLPFFVPMIAMVAIFYFLVLRPQSRKAKQHTLMLSELKKGDEVVTQGGIIGKISGITDAELTLQVQEGVRLRVLRSSVQSKYTPPERAKAEVKAS